MISVSTMQLQYHNLKMSNFGKRQLGPNQKAFKYEFSLQILKFRCQIPFRCSIRFMWKRNNKGIDTKTPYEVNAGVSELVINQKLSSISTIIFNSEKKEFLGKDSQLVVNMFLSDSPKKLASCQIDMKSILSPVNYKAARSEVFEMPLSLYINQNKGSLNDNRITFRLSCQFKEEIFMSEKSLGAGTLNTSGLSIPQDNKYFEKRYQAIPSKDSYSVTSYTNGIRYPSASKRQRDDSSSIRKYEYGFLAGLKSNISGGQMEPKGALRSVDNKTEINEGNYAAKQLIDEQNRRSKAEAELAKNTVQIGQLKKKINELAIDNIKLKQQLASNQSHKDTSSKEQNNALQFRIYELNNDLRDIKSQAEMRKQNIDKFQAECLKLNGEKSQLENQLQVRQKRIDELSKNQIQGKIVDSLQKDNQEMKYQNDNLRKFIEDQRRVNQEKETQLISEKYRETQQLTSKCEQMRREVERLRSNNQVSQQLQKKQLQIQDELRYKSTELSIKVSSISQLQKQVEQYKNRLTQYEAEKSFMQRQIIKLKQEANDKKDGDKVRLDRQKQEGEAKLQRLYSQNTKLASQVHEQQQLAEQRLKIIGKAEQQKGIAESKTNKMLLQINELQKRLTDFENENYMLKDRCSRLQNQRNSMQINLQKTKEEGTKVGSMTNSGTEVDRLFRQSLQMQVQLKFANDQLQRLRTIQQSFQNERWKAEKEKAERIQIEERCEYIEKERVAKNRALLIQVQKTKMMNQQLNELTSALHLHREQLDRSRNIIYNGQQQLTHLQEELHLRDQDLAYFQKENAQLKAQKQRLLLNNDEVRQVQSKVRELQARDAQKMVSLENMSNSLANASKEIKDLQKIAEDRHRQLLNREKQNQQMENRCRELQAARAQYEGEIAKGLQEKRMLEKRNQMIMEEIHGMKKRFEEEKGRSLSLTRNQEMGRVRTLQSEVEKRQKMISRLSKQKLQLQEQNVKINVQMMKLLNQMQKNKSSQNHPSLKLIGSLK